jgi:hypothetical protein
MNPKNQKNHLTSFLMTEPRQTKSKDKVSAETQPSPQLSRNPPTLIATGYETSSKLVRVIQERRGELPSSFKGLEVIGVYFCMGGISIDKYLKNPRLKLEELAMVGVDVLRNRFSEIARDLKLEPLAEDKLAENIFVQYYDIKDKAKIYGIRLRF